MVVEINRTAAASAALSTSIINVDVFITGNLRLLCLNQIAFWNVNTTSEGFVTGKLRSFSSGQFRSKDFLSVHSVHSVCSVVMVLKREPQKTRNAQKRN